MKNKTGSLTALAVVTITGTILAGSASAAPVTFAQYTQTNGAIQQWTVSNSGTTTTVSATGAVQFTLSGVSGLPFAQGPRAATFTLSATSGQIGNCGVACGPGDSYVEPGYSGMFSFIDTILGTNLLSGTFAVTGSPATTGAQFSSSIGSTGGSFNGSSTAGNLQQLVLTSSYLNFVGQTQEDASFSLSSLIPNFNVGTVTSGQAYVNGTFHAAGSGTFSSNPGPVSATPEPATFALIGSGFVALGLLRRKKVLLN